MNKTLIRLTMAVLLAGGVAAPSAFAYAKKHSPAHNAAVRKCGEEYEAAVRTAHAPNSPKGAARQRVMHAAAEAKKACIAKAPK